MDEKSKKKKKLKQKQKQRQKQKQSVIVNVNLGKSREKSSSESKPQNSRVQLPPPIHKVYTSPIHDLVPQVFNKEGKQAVQPTLAQQIATYLQAQEQTKQVNVLGEGISHKKSLRPILRAPTIQPEEEDIIQSQSETDTGIPVIVKERKKPGPKLGSKRRPRIYAQEVNEPPSVYGVAEPILEFSEKQLPDEFMREQFLLRQQPSNPNENRYETIFTSQREPDQPLGLTQMSKKERRKSKKTLSFQQEDEE